MTSRRPGRPNGSKTKKRPTVNETASRCPRCGSTDRTAYTQTRVVDGGGTAPDGKPFNQVRLGWTSCKACGQARIDRSYRQARTRSKRKK